MSGGSLPEWSQTEQVRAWIPAFALAIAILAAVTDPSYGADLVLCGLAAAPFFLWTHRPGLPLLALSLAVLVPVIVAQRSGQLEPLLFEASLLTFVVARAAPSTAAAVALGLLAMLAPVVASVIQDPSEIAVGIWIMGIAFPWLFGRAAARQGELVAQLRRTLRNLFVGRESQRWFRELRQPRLAIPFPAFVVVGGIYRARPRRPVELPALEAEPELRPR